MDVSILIKTWNNAKRLAITLDAIAKCRVPDGISWEVVVVNNNSTDDTDAVINSFVGRLPIVNIKEPVQGASRALNAGLKAAKGRLIIFTDDDVRPNPNWIVQHWDAFCSHPDGFYFGGPIESEFETPDFDNDLVALASCSVRGFDLKENSGPTQNGKYFLGANWGCPSAKLRQLGGFDETFGLNPASGRVMTGEESELIRALNQSGWQGYYLAEAVIRHYVPASKCQLAHIAGRWEAAGEKQAREIIRTQDFQVRPRVPFWVCKMLIASWFNWAGQRVLFRKGYGEYKLLCKNVRLVKVLIEELRARAVHGKD